jgi:hypothetical protein
MKQAQAVNTTTTTKETATMKTLKSKIEQAVLGEYDSIWKFCRALHIEGDDTDPEVRASWMLQQALSEYSSQRHYARKQYEDIMRACTNNIKTIDNNETINWEVDSDRVKEYNAKATAQVEVVKAVAYIIGLENETVQALFAALTKAGE